MRMKNKQRSLFHHKKGLEIKLRTKDTPDSIIKSLSNVAMQYSSLGDNDSAASYQQEAVRKLEEIKGQTTTAYISTLRNYGVILYRQRKYSQSADILESALKHRIKNKTTNTLMHMEAVYDTGKAYQRMGKHTKAISKYNEVVTMRQLAFSQMPDSLYVFEAYEGLIGEYMALNKLDDAKTAYLDTSQEIQRLMSLPDNSHEKHLELQRYQSVIDRKYKIMNDCKTSNGTISNTHDDS